MRSRCDGGMSKLPSEDENGSEEGERNRTICLSTSGRSDLDMCQPAVVYYTVIHAPCLHLHERKKMIAAMRLLTVADERVCCGRSRSFNVFNPPVQRSSSTATSPFLLPFSLVVSRAASVTRTVCCVKQPYAKSKSASAYEHGRKERSDVALNWPTVRCVPLLFITPRWPAF